MLLGVEGTEGRVAGTEEGKDATIPAWPGGGRHRDQAQRGLKGDNRKLRAW